MNNASGSIVDLVVSKLTGEISEGVYAEGTNFAVAHEAAVAFLAVNGATVRRSSSSRELKDREIMRKAEQWTVPLLCLANKPSA